MARKPITDQEVKDVVGIIMREVRRRNRTTVEIRAKEFEPVLHMANGEQAVGRIQSALRRHLQKQGISFKRLRDTFSFTVSNPSNSLPETSAKNDVDNIIKKKSNTFSDFDTEYIADPDIYPWVKIAIEKGNMPYVIGPPGCGKSRMYEEIFSDLGYESIRFSLDQVDDHTDLIGRDHLVETENGNTISKFVPGLLVQGIINGMGIILDELDRASSEAVKAMNMLAEKGGKMVVYTETGVKTFPKHPDARFCFSGNTSGRGDDTGFFQGATAINKAWLSRIGPKFYMDYDYVIERALLEQKDLPEPVLDILFKEDKSNPDKEGIILAIRRAITAKEIEDYLTTRSLLRFAEFYKVFGWNRAFESCIVSDFEEENQDRIRRIVTTRLGKSGIPTMQSSFISKTDVKLDLKKLGLE